MKIIGLLIAA